MGVGGRECEMKPSVLPLGMHLVGDVGGDEDLVVAGTVDGEVHIGGALLVEETGTVRGNVEARSVAIRGVVVGDAKARETIRVDSGGRVVGDLRAPRVNIVKGARFRGHVHMLEAAKAATATATATAIAPAPVPARAPERRDRRMRRVRPSSLATRDERPTAAGSIRAALERQTVPGDRAAEVAAAGPVLGPPMPRMPTLSRRRVRRRRDLE